MDLNNSVMMQLMGAQMRYQSQRQVVLSQNIANIDTPGYKARDIEKVNFDDLVKKQATRIEMRATSRAHLGSTNVFEGPYKNERLRKTFESKPEENSVSLEEQMAKINENNGQYQMTTNLYKKYTGMFRTAAVGTR